MTTVTQQIHNPKRGCGYLKHNSFYVRSAPSRAMGWEGLLPLFTEFKPAIRFMEQHFRGVAAFNGLAFELATNPATGLTDAEEAIIAEDLGGYSYPEWYAQEWASLTRLAPDCVEPTELGRHLARLRNQAGIWANEPITRQTLGHCPYPWQQDILMWVGESYYPDVDTFIKEGIEHGFNKRVRLNGAPPQFVRGLTKLYLLHPKAKLANGQIGPGLIGYCYMTEVIYTIPKDGVMPDFVDKLIQRRQVQPVHIGPQIAPLEDQIAAREESSPLLGDDE